MEITSATTKLAKITFKPALEVILQAIHPNAPAKEAEMSAAFLTLKNRQKPRMMIKKITNYKK